MCITVGCTMLDTSVILERYRPGSGDWDWPTEWADIIRIDHSNEDEGQESKLANQITPWRSTPSTLADLIADIAAHGMREPVLLSYDGRVLDGHHRLFVARLLGIETLPVEYRNW